MSAWSPVHTASVAVPAMGVVFDAAPAGYDFAANDAGFKCSNNPGF